MIEKLQELLHNRLIRFLAIEGAILLLVGVLSLVARFPLGTGLTLLGAAILVLQFAGGGQRVNPRSIGLEQQILRDIEKQRFGRAAQFMNELVLIGLATLALGILIDVVT